MQEGNGKAIHSCKTLDRWPIVIKTFFLKLQKGQKRKTVSYILFFMVLIYFLVAEACQSRRWTDIHRCMASLPTVNNIFCLEMDRVESIVGNGSARRRGMIYVGLVPNMLNKTMTASQDQVLLFCSLPENVSEVDVVTVSHWFVDTFEAFSLVLWPLSSWFAISNQKCHEREELSTTEHL